MMLNLFGEKINALKSPLSPAQRMDRDLKAAKARKARAKVKAGRRAARANR